MNQKRKKSKLLEIWRRLRKNKLAVAALIVLIALLLVALFAPLIAPYSYETQDAKNSYAKPSAEHLLGTDKLGRIY